MYEIIQKIYFWKAGTVDTHNLFKGVIVALILALIALAVWGLYKIRLRRLIAVLEEYQLLDEQSHNTTFKAQKNHEEKHQELVEEDDGRGPGSWKEDEFPQQSPETKGQSEEQFSKK